MRITLDIPEKLIDKAMEITGAKTKSQLIRDALQEQVDQEKRNQLIAHKGSIDLNVDLDNLRERN